MIFIEQFRPSFILQLLADYPMPESQWNKGLSVPFNDYANSLMLDGYVDFSYFGFLIYTTISSLCFLMVYNLYALTMNITMKYLCAFGFIIDFMLVETGCGAFFLL